MAYGTTFLALGFRNHVAVREGHVNALNRLTIEHQAPRHPTILCILCYVCKRGSLKFVLDS